MSQFPKLETKRLILRELTHHDSTDIYQFFHWMKLRSFMMWRALPTLNKQKN